MTETNLVGRSLSALAPSRSPREHRLEIEIAEGDIDHMGHVNNAVYLRWVQEAVVAHWSSAAPAVAAGRYLWVALKHEITYRRPAFLGDPIVAEVELELVRGARALYRTLIKRGEEVLAEVNSSWCSVDRASRRPARLTVDLLQRFGFGAGGAAA